MTLSEVSFLFARPSENRMTDVKTSAKKKPAAKRHGRQRASVAKKAVTLSFHPLANTLPLLEGEEFDAFVAAAVRTPDVREPISLYEGKILDGRNRYRAAQTLGIDWPTQVYEGDDPVGFVLTKNVTGLRHLNPSQRAAAAVEIECYEAELAKKRMRLGGVHKGTEIIPDPGEAREKAAKRVGANPHYVSDAKKIAKEMPELFAAIKAGKKTIFQAKKEIVQTQRKIDLARPVNVTLAPGFYHGDFRELSDKIENNSVDLIFTDPDYTADGLAQHPYENAAKVAARILKPGGSFIAYSGLYALPVVFEECGKHLQYFWMIAAYHNDPPIFMNKRGFCKYGIYTGWKPLVWYVKGWRGDAANILSDVTTAEKREKDHHPWQQAEIEATYYIEKLTSEGGLVVDFFLGSGTTAAAAQKLGRRFIGFEINAASIERASERLRQVAVKEAAE